MWPGCKLVHGNPRHSQSQGSVERPNKDVEDILACWMRENNISKWSDGLRFVQYKKTVVYIVVLDVLHTRQCLESRDMSVVCGCQTTFGPVRNGGAVIGGFEWSWITPRASIGVRGD